MAYGPLASRSDHGRMDAAGSKSVWSGRAAWAALLVAGALAWSASSAAHADAGQLIVGATIKRHTTVRLDVPQLLTISDADLKRGYVEVGAPVEVAVQSNVREGYTLMVRNRGEQVRETVVQGPAGALVVGAGGGVLSRPAAGSGMWSETLQLRIRFQLSPGAQAGTYSWPLQISMMSE